MVILFEGRDATGKRWYHKKINGAPQSQGRPGRGPGKTDRRRKKVNGIFNAYVKHLPTNGEIVLFDRSWAMGREVENVMGFCTNEEYNEFIQVPEFERNLVQRPIPHQILV